MGHNPIRIQMLSDPANSKNFRNLNGLVNYEDECYSVDLPIFAIHGNHDDPTRDGGELLAALDLLAMSNLVNYFGKRSSHRVIFDSYCIYDFIIL
jgi:double-strand break repair protein MRE11